MGSTVCGLFLLRLLLLLLFFFAVGLRLRGLDRMMVGADVRMSRWGMLRTSGGSWTSL